MGILRILISISFSLGVISCQEKIIRFKDDELQLEQQSYSGSQLKINGYYYQNEEFDNNNQEYYYPRVFFFYQNGVLFGGAGVEQAGVSNWESECQDGTYYSRNSGVKYYWGIFQMEGSTIRYEKWYVSEGKLPAYVMEGDILNDTTFHITSSYRLTKRGKKKELTEEDDYFHFKELSPKPDSTNSFIP